ncbi:MULTISPECIES: hypothetical protein [Streptomyces]|uniref:hypothetical protein n=1 Tax=Streptomyces TaxID=1883 RepID=UPI00295E3101|nr:hypothetical protein [Streptomyces sp. JV180]
MRSTGPVMRWPMVGTAKGSTPMMRRASPMDEWAWSDKANRTQSYGPSPDVVEPCRAR